MKAIFKHGVAFAALMLSGALAGCQTTGATYPTISWAGTESAYVQFTAAAFENTPSKHVVFTDVWVHEEYVLFEGGGAHERREEREELGSQEPDSEPGMSHYRLGAEELEPPSV